MGIDISESVSGIVSTVLKKSLAEAEKGVEKLISETEGKLKKLEDSRAVLHVKVNKKERKLSSRAVPYLEDMVLHAGLGLNTLLIGPAGCGKTTAARQLSEALDLKFGSVCLTAGASETWLFGRQTPNGFVEGVFSTLYREGGVFLADEMDAADANLLLSINTAIANGVMFNPMSGETIERHEDFVFVGAANTFGKSADHVYTGRSRLDGATLDRFVSIKVNYDSDYEKYLCPHKPLAVVLLTTREKLLDQGFEEIVSTRMFDVAYKLYMNEVPLSKIVNRLTVTWGKEAQKVMVDSLNSVLRGF